MSEELKFMIAFLAFSAFLCTMSMVEGCLERDKLRSHEAAQQQCGNTKGYYDCVCNPAKDGPWRP